MPALPTTVKTGTVHWQVMTDFMPPGVASPIMMPAKGYVIIEPVKSSLNIDSPDAQMTLGLNRRQISLDENGSFSVNLIADYQGTGWNYKVTPVFTVIDDGGKYGKASGDLAESFYFYLPPGQTVNLDDERPVGRNPSTGQAVSRGTGLTGEVLQVGNVIQFVMTDGTTSAPVTLPTVMSDGTTATMPVDTAPMTPITN